MVTRMAKSIETMLKKADRAEEAQWLFPTIKLHDGAENTETVFPRAELAGRALRPREIGRLDLGDRQRELQRMNAQFGLDLEAIGKHWEGFEEAPREDAISGQHIFEVLTELTENR